MPRFYVLAFPNGQLLGDVGLRGSYLFWSRADAERALAKLPQFDLVIEDFASRLVVHELCHNALEKLPQR